MDIENYLERALLEFIKRSDLVVFDEDQKSLKSVVSMSWNNGALQLNVERWEADDDSAEHA